MDATASDAPGALLPARRDDAADSLAARALAHELSNALAGVLGAAQLLERRLAPGSPEHAKVALIRASLTRVSGLPSVLASLAAAAFDSSHTDLTETAPKVVPILQQVAGPAVMVSARTDGRVWVPISERRSAILFALLGLLARRALPQGGRFELLTRQTSSGTSTLSASFAGTGLTTPWAGASIRDDDLDLTAQALRAIVDDAGGRIDSSEDVETGVSVTLTFPAGGQERAGR